MTKLRAVLRRRWSMLLMGLVLGMIAGGFSSVIAPDRSDEPIYKVAQLVIANRTAQLQGSVQQDALRVTRGEVARRAAKTMGVDSGNVAASKVIATADPDSLSIEISTTDKDPKVATKRVQAFANAFLEVVNEDLTREQNRRFTDLQNQVDQAEADLAAFDEANPMLGRVPYSNKEIEDALLQQRSELRQALNSANDSLRTERLNAKAALPYSTLGPDSPKIANGNILPIPTSLPFRMLLLGLFGTLLTAATIMIVERVVPRIDTRDELTDAIELPLLAEVGYFPHASIPEDSNGVLTLEGAWAEPYRRIRSAIQFVQSEAAGTPARVFMITSPAPSEGKSTTTAVTAMAMAETGERTLVVGGDFRRPSIHNLLGVPKAPGIREHARLDMERPELDQIVHPTTHENLFVAPSGAAGREVVGLVDAATELISAAVAEGATVLVDTSPIEVANDAIDMLPVVDAVMVLVRSGSTTRRSLLNAVEVLEQHGANIMGVVLIATPGLGRRQYYYQGYYAEEAPADTSGGGTIFPGSEPPPPYGPSSNGVQRPPQSAASGDGATIQSIPLRTRIPETGVEVINGTAPVPSFRPPTPKPDVVNGFDTSTDMTDQAELKHH